jgi:plastocyanin
MVRPLPAVSALALALGLVWGVAIPSTAAATTPTVTVYDNDAPGPSQGFAAGQGMWGYGPNHIMAIQGEGIVFNNPASNKLPHTVTNLQRIGSPFDNQVAAGTLFDSSPTRETLMAPGTSWTLDTSMLEQGHYAYYCRIHPWMVGSVTVTGQ